MATIQIDFDSRDITNNLANAAQIFSQGRFRMLMERIGALVANQTQTRFSTQRGPDNVPWARRRNNRDPNRAILTQTARLRRSIRFEARDSSVLVGTDVPYGRYHQEGTARGLPARPFLGVNMANERQILQLVDIFLQELLPL